MNFRFIPLIFQFVMLDYIAMVVAITFTLENQCYV